MKELSIQRTSRITTVDEPLTDRTLVEIYPESAYFNRDAFKREFEDQCFGLTECYAAIDTDLFIDFSSAPADHEIADAYMSFVQIECGQTLE